MATLQETTASQNKNFSMRAINVIVHVFRRPLPVLEVQQR
jgi:hypothetical protein